MRRRGNVISPVDSLSDLGDQLQQTDSTVEDGETVWVRSSQALFVYRTNSGLQPNGATVVGARYGLGVWQRLGVGAGVSSQAAWFVDPTNPLANDQNNGASPLTPLATTVELMRRIGFGTTLVAPTTITFNSNVPATDALCGYVRLGPGASLVLAGKTIALASGVLRGPTAVTVQNRVTQTPWSLSDNLLVGGIGQYVGKFLQIDSGPRVGATGRICKDVGGTNHDAMVSPLCVFVSTDTVPAATTPVAGDTYTVFDVTTVYVGNLRVEAASTEKATPSAGNCLLMSGIRLQGGGGSNPFPNGGITTRFLSSYAQPGCIFDNVQIDSQMAQWTALACGWDNLIALFQTDHTSGGPVVPAWYACATPSNPASGITQLNVKGGQVKLDLDCYLEKANILLNTNTAIEAGLVAIFDGFNNAGMIINPGGVYFSTPVQSTDLLWGTSNGGHAVVLRAGGSLIYVTRPTVNAGLGTGREALIGGVDTLWSAVTNNIAPNRAMVVQQV